MKKTRVIIPSGENEHARLPQILNIFVAFAQIDQQTVPEKCKQFVDGPGFYFDISEDKLVPLLNRLTRDGFKYKTEDLE